MLGIVGIISVYFYAERENNVLSAQRTRLQNLFGYWANVKYSAYALLMSDDPTLTGLAKSYLDDLRRMTSAEREGKVPDELKGGDAFNNN